MKNTRTGLNLSTKEINTLNALDSKRNGAYFRIQYYTDCNSKISASWRGHNVTKLTTMSVRKGVSYENLKTVIERRINGEYKPGTRELWYYHIDKMLCKHHTKEQYYVALFPNKYGHADTIYMLDGMPITKQKLQEMGVMQPSFWSKKEKPEMMTLGLDKIVNVY